MNYTELYRHLKIITHTTDDIDPDSLVNSLKQLDESLNATALPAKLKHYLSKRSYIKALNYIEENILADE